MYPEIPLDGGTEKFFSILFPIFHNFISTSAIIYFLLEVQLQVLLKGNKIIKPT